MDARRTLISVIIVMIGLFANINSDIIDDWLDDHIQDQEKDNEILEVFEKGYKYRDRVIRHAKVVVNKS